ncbi:integration host factor subunit beta [Buchnera aphidicola]|uniref:Integration host factor subunit beta n=1 Tax=Buchnera aphidicola subsp. Rhopalosiphum maidis TaxID=118109 RepID=A0A3G2I6Y4_BUCRM|nr:integration host factor subunit beta [Buchnera aphidicola]AYN24758.1 integration host factor subunit beta [Buchnera aphidicola (Rhopalosiphum maidis)]
MTKSELFERIAEQKAHISNKIIEHAVKEMLEYMSISLSKGKRIEIRGFGSFSLHYRSSRIGRNPKTGKKIKLNEKYVPYFKPGKQLRDRANLYK